MSGTKLVQIGPETTVSQSGGLVWGLWTNEPDAETDSRWLGLGAACFRTNGFDYLKLDGVALLVTDLSRAYLTL